MMGDFICIGILMPRIEKKEETRILLEHETCPGRPVCLGTLIVKIQ